LSVGVVGKAVSGLPGRRDGHPGVAAGPRLNKVLSVGFEGVAAGP
jgi:hypothetical protein